jgi:IclR family transcriptional regulator, KDG regulon repressor
MSEIKGDIQSLARGLDIMILLSESDRSLGITEIAQHFKLDKSTAFRLVSTLAKRGFVVQDSDSRRYHAGFRMLSLARRLLDRLEVRSIASPLLKELQTTTAESSHLAVIADRHVVYIDRQDTGAALSVNTEIGGNAPLHCTAVGKALLVDFGTDPLISLLGSEPFQIFTPRTARNLSELLPHLEQTKQVGYAVDDEESFEGVRCVAAPVRNHLGKVIASVGISGPSIRISQERIPKLGAVVVDIAQKISSRMGYPSKT